MNLVYIYHSPNEIFKNIKLISNFDIFDFIFLVMIILFFIIVLLYILPILYSIKEEFLLHKTKKHKKIMLKKIIMQKEIEDEILKEIRNRF